MPRLNIERQNDLEPKRIDYAVSQLESIGKQVFYLNENSLKFTHNGHVITLFPYSGWFTGKGIKDGRGLQNLLKQLK